MPATDPPTDPPLGPVPTGVSIGTAPMDDGTRRVIMRFATEMGAFVHFFEAEAAVAIAESILECVNSLRSGAAIPTPVTNGHRQRAE